MTTNPFPSDDLEFEALRTDVAARVDHEARFPRWPFRGAPGCAVLFEYDRIIGGDFGAVLAALSDSYGDKEVTVIGLDPPYRYYREEYDHFPGFRIKGDEARTAYGAAMRFAPGGDPTGALIDSLNVMAISGSTGAWGVFGQRDWEIGLLLAADRAGSWLGAGIPWSSPDIDLDGIRSPVGWGMPLSEQQKAEFLREWLEHDC